MEPHQVGRAFAHFLLRPLVEGHEAHGTRGQSPVGEEMPGALGEHAGLARPGRRDDPRCSPGVRDGSELIGREFGGRTVRCRRRHRAVLDRDHVDNRYTSDRLDVAHWAGIEPGGAAVGKHDVARRVRRNGIEPGSHGTIERVPGGTGAQVDRVGPEQVVEFVAGELEVGARLGTAPPRSSASGCGQRRSDRRDHLELGVDFDDESDPGGEQQRAAPAAPGSVTSGCPAPTTVRAASPHGSETAAPATTSAWRPS